MNHKIFFFTVHDRRQKIHKIIQATHYHFQNQQKLLIFCSNRDITEYIDELLWKEPKDSFLPHDIDGDDFIVISHDRQKLTATFSYIFNLTALPLHLSQPSRVVYELLDKTSEEKRALSQKKHKFYESKKYFIQMR